MTDHGQLAIARAAAVNIAVASSHRPCPGSKVRPCDVDERLAKGRAARLIANEGREDIAFLQKHAAGDADCFLAFADVDATGDPTTAIHASEFFFERSR